MIRLTPVRTIALAVALAAVVAGAYGLWTVFLQPAGPPPVSLSTRGPGATGSGAIPSSATPRGSGLSGTWVAQSNADTFVGYRVQEQLSGVGGNTAVGRTSAVSGTLMIDGTKVTAVEITADLTGLRSDDNRRDGQLRRQSLQTDQFPTATFRLTQPIDLGSTPAEGQALTVTATGDLTLHGQTKNVQIPMQARLSEGVIEVTGSLEIAFADYGIQKPQALSVLSVADTGTMELHLFFG
jgi:polyisoprenoid-binding protein YceI